MTTSFAVRRQTAADLRSELEGVTAQLDAAQQHWRALGDDPASFQKRAHVAAAITDLRQRAEALPAAIARAEECDTALEALRRKDSEAHPIAARALTQLIVSLPTRDQMRGVLQGCATANAIASTLERYEAALRTLGAIRDQVTANVEAATAAKDNAAAAKQTAETAEKQLRLAYRPHFDLKEVSVESDAPHPTSPPKNVTVSYNVYNASSTWATVFRLDTGYKVIQGGDGIELSGGGGAYETTFAPGRGYRAPIHVELSSDVAKEAYVHNKLIIDVMYRIWFKDPFGDEHNQTMKRQVVCGPGTVTSVRGSFTGLADDN
jgi:hypothetical protein